MPNPLAIMTAVQPMSSKAETHQDKGHDSKGGVDFEDVLNADGEYPEVEAVEVMISDIEEPSEQSDSEISEDGASEDTSKIDEALLALPLTTALDAPTPGNRPAEVSQDVYPTALASETTVNRPNSEAITSPQTPNIAMIKPVVHPLEQSAPSRAVPDQIAHTGPKRIPPQTLDPTMLSLALTMNASPKQELRKADTEMRFGIRVSGAPVEQEIQQVNSHSSLASQPLVKPLAPSPVNASIDLDNSPETEDMFRPKDLAAGQTLRESTQTMPISTARVEIARAVAGQLAAAISTRPSAGGVEIALNPEELGRVSITLNGREDGFYLTIAAERPETLDLMRRHIAILSAEFERLGYRDLSLDLGLSGDTAQRDAPPDHTASANAIDGADNNGARAPTIQIGPQRGLDMRL